MLNLTGSMSIFPGKDTASVVLVNADVYTAYSCLQASLSSLFINMFELGLIYIPFGVGCFVAFQLCKFGYLLSNFVEAFWEQELQVPGITQRFSRMNTATSPPIKAFPCAAVNLPVPEACLSNLSRLVFQA